jgi:hypothetical protein
MKSDMVTTHEGKSIKVENSVLIDGVYYNKKKRVKIDVVKVKDEWVLYDKDKYVKPFKASQYILKKNSIALLLNVTEGIPKFEYFRNFDYLYSFLKKYTKENNIVKPNNSKYFASLGGVHPLNDFGVKYMTAVNGNDFERLGYRLHKLDGVYFKIPPKDLSSIDSIIKNEYIQPIKKVGYLPGNYDSSTSIKYGEKSPSYLLSERLKYTYGIELETCSGKIFPFEYADNNLNITCDHDGSIKGGEYVTGVLKGDAGFKQLYNICSFLKDRCSVDKTCGIHVHVGGVVFNKSFVVLSYLLGRKIEKEMFSIMPPSRRNNKYCGKLLDLKIQSIFDEYGYDYGIDIAYEELYKALSNGNKLGKKFNKSNKHPQGRYCGQYHSVPFENILRYKWLNLVPCTFNQRGYMEPVSKKGKANTETSYTIEFRNHSASLDYTKIKNWTLICMAFVNYVENNGNDIVKKDSISLEDIINSTYKRNREPLMKYIDKRKSKFSEKMSASDELIEIKENIQYNNKIKMKEFLCV